MDRWSRSLPLKCFCAELEGWMDGFGDASRLSQVAETLASEALEHRILPEQLLVLVKRSCPGIPGGEDNSGHAESTERSGRYIAALDILWARYFREAERGKPQAGS